MREQVTENNIKLEYIGTKKNIANIFTKPIPRKIFEYLQQKLGLIFAPNWFTQSFARTKRWILSGGVTLFHWSQRGREKK
jgi:hypothetical protein